MGPVGQARLSVRAVVAGESGAHPVSFHPKSGRAVDLKPLCTSRLTRAMRLWHAGAKDRYEVGRRRYGRELRS